MTDTMTTNDDVLEGEIVSDVAGGSETPPVKNKRNTKKAAAKTKAVAKAAPKPVEKSELTPSQARKLTAQLRAGVTQTAELFISAYSKRIWLALGHATWPEYLDAELGDLRPKLPKDERLRMVAQMVAAKMSTRAIASSLGMDQKTISNDVAELREEGIIQVPATRVGLDGKEQTTERQEKAPDPEKVAAKYVDKFTKVFSKLDELAGDLLELSQDELWEDNAAKVAQIHRADMTHVLSTLATVAQRFPGAE